MPDGRERRRGRGDLPPSGWIAAGHRARRGPGQGAFAGRAAGASGAPLGRSDRRRARSPSPPADDARHHCLELRSALRAGAATLSAPGHLRRWMHLRGSGGDRQRARMILTSIPSTGLPPWSTRASCSGWRERTGSRASRCWRRSASSVWNNLASPESWTRSAASTRPIFSPSPNSASQRRSPPPHSLSSIALPPTTTISAPLAIGSVMEAPSRNACDSPRPVPRTGTPGGTCVRARRGCTTPWRQPSRPPARPKVTC